MASVPAELHSECDHEMGCKTLRKTEKGPRRARANGHTKATHQQNTWIFATLY